MVRVSDLDSTKDRRAVTTIIRGGFTVAKWIEDAGHGGSDIGGNGFGQVEKEWTLEASQYVNKRLNELGVQSFQTRTKDLTLDSVTRTNTVRNSGAKYCLSHHFNAFNGSARGVETIHSIYADDKLATKLCDAIVKASGFPKRRVFSRKGNNGDYYFMHRLTGSVQTIIIEYGFLDNKEDYAKLKSKSFRVKLYESVIKTVCEWEKVAYKPVEQIDENLFYRVVTGSFNSKELAEERMKLIKDRSNLDSFLITFRKDDK